VRRWRTALAVAAITALAAALRWWGLRFGLPRTMARPDEEAIVAIAARVVTIGPNPHFFDYPTLFMYVVAFVERSWPGGRAVFDDVVPTMIARTLAAALGTASVPLLFVAARRLFSPRAALAAAALLAVAFLHARDSHFGVTDVPMTFMVLLAFCAIVSLRFDGGRWWNVLAAAVLCGLATSTKYNAALVFAPLLVALAQARSSPATYAIAAVAFLAAFFAGTPYALVDRAKFVHDLGGLQSHLAAGHGSDQGLGWIYHLTFTLRYGLGLAFLIAAIAGAVAAIVEDRRKAALVLSFPALYYLAMGSGRTVFMRHMIPVVPFAALLAGVFVDRVAALAARRSAAAGALVAVLLTTALGYDSARRTLRIDELLAVPDSRTLAAAMLEARYPQGATVYQNGPVYAHVQLWPEGIFPETAIDRRPLLVILNSSPLVAYRDEPAGVAPILHDRYRELGTIEAESVSDAAEGIYDQQDAFFLPVAHFDGVIRPGPELRIFERIDR